jgi:hypothetical protein
MFGFQRLIAAIVRRSVLLVFADPGARAREAMAARIARHLCKGKGDDEIDLFWLLDDAADPRPIQSASPPLGDSEPTYLEGNARTLVIPPSRRGAAAIANIY